MNTIPMLNTKHHDVSCPDHAQRAEIAISAQNLGKSHRLWKDPSDRLKQSLRSLMARWTPIGNKEYCKEFWALKEITFDVGKGATVGIVGRNGSGKSTLLQIICGTLAPTCGTYETHGRISALLELGAGFNPDFSGRDNVYMNASILGLTKKQTDERYESIAEFADIGEFIDQPVRTYSSGMYVRLAFAVAINVQPDILVVDEALAVGDELFQRKCYSKLRSLQKSGATILFVTHSTDIIVELCSEAILLESGRILLRGSPRDVVSQYHRLFHAPKNRRNQLQLDIAHEKTEPAKRNRASAKIEKDLNHEPSDELRPYFDPNLLVKQPISYCSQGAIIENPTIQTLDGHKVNTLIHGATYIYSYDVRFRRACYSIRFGMLIKTLTGFELGGAVSSSPENAIPYIRENSEISVKWRFRCSLTQGVYFTNGGVLGFNGSEEIYLDRKLDLMAFRVLSEKSHVTGIMDFCVKCDFMDRHTVAPGIENY